MKGIKLGPEEMKFITLFEGVTQTKVRDCVMGEDGELTFVVNQAELGKCLGRGGGNLKRFAKIIGRPIHVVGYSEDFQEFVKNLFYPAEVTRILRSDDGKTVTVEVRFGSKGLALGEGKKRLARAKKLLARFHGVREVMVRTSHL
ncbi:MAG: NusA-like transcription termination signal-binding factor [Candidatus Hadarchaeales archaeon]